MLQLAVCDDERVFRSDLRKLLGTELELCGIDYHISEFTSGEELIAGMEKADCQILFLDIEMKGIDGVEEARRLRETKRQMEIVFVTSYADFVFQGYEVRALNYILKPYESEKIRGGEVLCDRPAGRQHPGAPVVCEIFFQRPAHSACGDHRAGIYIL